MAIADRHSFRHRTGRHTGQVAEGAHLRSGATGQWVEHFTDAHRRVFKELAGEQVVALGYETGLDW